MKFEKANYDRDNIYNNKRKRPILSASRDGYCATPPMAREISLERVKKLKDGLNGSHTLLGILLEDSDCKPFALFPTSLTTSANFDDSLITVDPRQEVFDSFTKEIEWKHVHEPCHKFVTDILCVSKEEVKAIEKETMGQSCNKKWLVERSKRLTSSNFRLVVKRRMHIYPKSILNKVLENKRVTTEACRWGLDNESVTKEKYNEKCPQAKPDGLSLLNSEWYGIEIKCPFSKKDLKIKETCSDKTFCMNDYYQ